MVLVNNDTVVAEDAFAGFAEVAAEHPGAGALAGKIYLAEPPDRIWFAGQRYLTGLGYSGRARGLGQTRLRPLPGGGPNGSRGGSPDGRLPAGDRARRVAATDDLFAYVEDVDWSLRIRDAGFEVLFVPGARAWHTVAASTGGPGLRHTTSTTARATPSWSASAIAPCPRPFSSLRRGVVLATFTAHALRPTQSSRRAGRCLGGLPRRSRRAPGRAPLERPAVGLQRSRGRCAPS